MSARPTSRPWTLLAALAAVLLLAVLPALVGLLSGPPTPEQGLSPAAVARDLSAAALDRLDRLLQGECVVALALPARDLLPASSSTDASGAAAPAPDERRVLAAATSRRR